MGGIKNDKSLGQHWLKNRVILDEIASFAVKPSAEQSSDKTGVEQKDGICLEIGPGLGTLTSALLRLFSKVIAVEFDSRLAANLPKSFPGKNLEVINEDILKLDFNELFSKERICGDDYVVAGNIPYYITSPIIEKVLMLEKRPKRVVLLIQKEVAERILDKKETLLSLFVKNRAKVFSGPIVRREEFTPPPKVDSQVIVFEPHEPTVSDEVFKLIKIGFLAPRKKLVHNLLKVKDRDAIFVIFDRLGIEKNVRPGDLSLDEWKKLYDLIKE